MSRWIFPILFFCLSDTHAGEVRIAVSANFLATLNILKPVYEEKSGDSLIISGASSGKHYAHIINGAPYDVLLSADRYYPQQLLKAGLAVAGENFVYAVGRLVLWSGDRQRFDPEALRKLDARLAIANVRTAPYGRAARQYLQSTGQWHEVQDMLVRGENVGQTFQFVASGNARLGFVALSQVLNPKNRFNRELYWLVPQEYYSPLEQEAVLLAYGKDNEAARRFLGFLESDVARDMMKRYGYL